jgi:hypothetical protein
LETGWGIGSGVRGKRNQLDRRGVPPAKPAADEVPSTKFPRRSADDEVPTTKFRRRSSLVEVPAT